MSEVRLIDANALEKAIEQYQVQWNRNREYDIAQWDCCESILAIIDNAPTLPNPCGNPCNFKRPTGEWIMNKTSSRGRNYTCTHCKRISRNKSEYCPKCGARMEVEEE
jgi:hypothetical protein